MHLLFFMSKTSFMPGISNRKIPNRLMQLTQLMPFMRRVNILQHLRETFNKNFSNRNGRDKRSLSATGEQRASLVTNRLIQLTQLMPFTRRVNNLEQLREIFDKTSPNRDGRDKWNGTHAMKKRYNPIFYPNRKGDNSKFYNTPRIKNSLRNLS